MTQTTNKGITMTATITAKMVSELRAQTGAGMSDCKKALEETQGSIEDAIKHLREKGVLKAAKRADRTAAEGLVGFANAADLRSGTIVELNCETDFVARNEAFVKLSDDLAKAALAAKANTVEALNATKLGDSTAEVAVQDMLSKMGEKIEVSSVYTMEGDVVSAYIHPPGKIGVLLSAKGENLTDAGRAAVANALREVGMHVAAYAPRFLNEKSVDPKTLEVEKEIAANILRGQGKPEEMIVKIVEGKMRSFCAENCLTLQAFAKNESMTVAAYVASEGKNAGATNVEITGFQRVQVGAKAAESNN
jgi:elongation factor Ts